MKLSFNKKAKQRIISFTTAFAIMANAVPLGGLSDRVLPLVSLNAKAVDAVDEVTTDELTQVNALKLDAEPYTVTKQSSEFENDNAYVSYNSDTNNYSITFPNITWFLDYCWHYKYNDGFADRHKNDELDLSLTNDESGVRGTIPNTYEGLGTPSIPFDGTVKFSGNESFTIKAHRAFFGAVTDSVQLQSDATNQQIELILVRLSDVPDGESLPLLADQVVHNGGTADWKVTLSSASSNSYSGVIGEIESGASVKLDYTNESSANLASVSSVGEICGTMKDGSSIELTYSATSAHSITSSGGNAGGLVGTMIDNASLTVKTMPSVSLSAESTSAYAGGLVGELTSQATITNQTGSAIPVSGSITSDAGAGGLFGHYTNSETEFDLIDYNNTATVDGQFCGGVFGVLENSTALTVKNTGAGTLTVNSGTTGNTDGYFGGIAGKYTTNALSNSLVFDGLTLTATANATYSAFGGAIGIVDPAAYVQTTGTMSVTASGTTKANYFGGLVGATSADRGVFVDLENFTLNTGSENFKGGGVVGLFNNGVLRLSGTTTMTNAKPASATNCGQLVGDNNNVLTYAASGWTFNRSNGAMTDDLGTWGEVVRVAESDIVTVDSTAHTVTLKAAETSMGSAADFAKTALNIQLNQGGDYDCLKFTSGNNTRSYLLGTGLSLSADISLAGTGITGFMRDGGAVNSIDSFTGTFDGNGHTITLAIGEKYGNGVNASTNSEGVGQIYRHQHNGLFAVLAGTVEDLTIAGTINVSNCVDGMNIGGIASRNNGDITLTNVIAKETVNYNESAKVSVSDEGKNIGGYIGFVGTKGTITINGVSSIGATFNLKGSHESWNVYGGAIGKITAGEFTVKIGTKGDNANKLTNSLTTDISDITNVGANSDSGGLIGYITNAGSYAKRQVNINNLEISNCTIGNAASTNGGGFLGYAWLNTTTNVNGVTVTNGTINNTANNKTAGNVGVMLYSSTGKMKVDSLSINGLTMSAGGTTSLGMIVNKAYSLNDKNEVTGALYLDVLNAGYSLNGTTAPEQATGIFDEIAAYSAPNVINGGAGVISINMNESRDTNNANFKTTGTYQNKMSVSDDLKANSNARYYYNVDKMSSSDAGQNLVLWSLSKYAHSDINGEFVHTETHDFGTTLNTTLSGNADLEGLSFYPINANSYNISGLNLTMDYSGVYDAESKFGTYNPNDSYVRDPGVENQHYLMHSGLFTNLSNANTITISGTNTFKGNFLELSNASVSGVLVSKTSNGSIISSSDSKLVLDELVAKTTQNRDYSDGYLLVNNITRINSVDSKDDIKIYLEGISTKNYESDTIVAKSLLGAASGANLNIEFSKIKLDSRTNALSDSTANTALNKAYGTTRSIFSTSTLLASIKTDDKAQLKYYYSENEDWGSDGTDGERWVTYGKEVKDSKEYQKLEQKYDGSSYYTHPVNWHSNSAYDFGTGFLPYVAEPFTASQANSIYYRELKVNVTADGLTEGCGTYNDPYVINDGKQLTAVARFISTGSTDELSKITLPKAKDNFDNIAENASGSRWCTDKEGTGYHADFAPNSGKTAYENGSISWEIKNVQYYLANAYYKIDGDIKLSGDISTGFVGLGGLEANLAFRGVIVGEKNSDGSPKYTITNNSSNPFIKVSNGCVVKDIIIEVGADISLDQGTNGYNNAYFGYASQCKYYGGIIGEIMGGDNIIDNSYVKFASDKKVTLTGTNGSGTIVPVGGYVGVVVFGGLIFKNMDALKTTVSKTRLNVIYMGKTENLADNDKPEDWAAIYVNPIVGRVINGYAVNETGGNALDADGKKVQQFSVTEDGKYHDEGRTARSAATIQHTLKNGTKHYSIADINKNETNKLDVSAVPASASSDGTINIPNSQAFFILSLITQSCAGTAQGASGDYANSLSYGTNKINNVDTVYGMSRNADYTNVGSATDNTDSDFVLASNDTTANSATPYIIDRYCTNHNARCVTSTLGYYDIYLTGKATYSVDSYTYQLPDSFRGIGSVGNYDCESTLLNNKFSMKVDVFNGNNCMIDEDIYLNKFKSDNYFDVMHKGTNQEVKSNTGTYSTNTNTDNHGIGLFDSIISKDATNTISNFVLTGSVNTEMYSNTYKDSGQEEVFTASGAKASWLSVSGVVGWSRGAADNDASHQQGISFNKITLDNLSLCGDNFVGGLLAYSGMRSKTKKITITECSANNISVKMSSAYYGDTDAKKTRNAMGCFVGKVHEGAAIVYGTSQKENNSDITKFSTVKIKSYGFGVSTGDYRVASGGLVGYAGNGCQAYDMKICSYDSAVTIGLNSGTSFVGGIVGAMQPSTDGDTDCLAVFKNCTIENINIAGQCAGGLYGGKWEYKNYNPYKIEIINCSLIGNNTVNNTITAKTYAGGFIAWAFVQTRNGDDYNIRIVDSKVSNYTISSAKDGYSGGFIGYCRANNNSITCYIHDSSVENCIIGQSGSVDYAGGIIGGIKKHDENKILGYNIKLYNVTSPSSNRKGAWIGNVASDDNNTSIQFSGMTVYGGNFTQNVGNRTNFSNASFVFADYTGKCNGTQTTDSETGVSSTEYPTDISGFSNYSTSTPM